MTASETNEPANRLASLAPAERHLLEKTVCSEGASSDPIAIVGLGCRFAGAWSVESFWELARQGRVATGEIPPSRWDVDALYDRTGQTPGKMTNRWGGFVDDVDQFDPFFFGISPREAENMDPQQRLLLEVVWEALEYGGIAPGRLAGSRTGAFVGIGGVDYSRIPARMRGYLKHVNLYSGTGNALSIASNRLSYVLDLRGPSLSVDTACSSALVAVHLAVRSLRERECDMALAGGCNLILSPETTLAFSKAQMLSIDGVCRPFDAGANGYVRGEGCGILVLKRLDEARADRDRVLAVIRGTAINQDGRTSGIAAPNPRAQEAVIRAAHQDAKVRPDQISYIEAHGTGTPLGDPMEWEALAQLFAESSGAAAPCYVGSVKGNVGHTETAAGAAGLIKTVLMMQHQQILPQATFQELNPRISLEGCRLRIADRVREWTWDGRRIAGVSSFGFGGTNSHVIVEEAVPPESPNHKQDRPYHLLTLSAKSENALHQQADRFEAHLREHPGAELADVCFTAHVGRSHFDHRLAVVAPSTEDMASRLASFDGAKPQAAVHSGHRSSIGRPHVAFLFSGQGCQYSGMGRRLFETEPVFRDALIQCDELLERWLDFPLLSLMHRPEHGERLNQTRYLQPALFSLQYALAVLWRSWGVTPDVVLGHSVGEFAAACHAGVLQLDDAVELIAERARLMAELPAGGAMAAVFADRDRVLRMVEPYGPGVSVAAFNGPENTVISGKAELVEKLVGEFRAQGLGSQRLSVSHAFHSQLMEPMLVEFLECAEMLDYETAQCPFISSVTGKPFAESVPDAVYWRDQVCKPVQYARAVEKLAAYEPEIVLEIGPSGTAIGMARRCPVELEAVWLPSMRKGDDDSRVILNSLAEIYVRGGDVDWDGYDRPWPRNRLRLPTYPFERKRYWHQGELDGQAGASGAAWGPSLHPLLGAAVPNAAPQEFFAASVSGRTPAFLADHEIQGSVVMPAACYVEQALAAGEQVLPAGHHQLENLSIQQAMVLPLDTTRWMQTLLTPESKDEYRLEVHSRGESIDGDEKDKRDWVLHASGTIRRVAGEDTPDAPEPVRIDALSDRMDRQIEGKALYAEFAERGLIYGQAFSVLDELRVSEGEVLASLKIPRAVERELPAYHVHPALLDGGLQTIAGVVQGAASGEDRAAAYLPTFVRKVRVYRRGVAPALAYAVQAPRDSEFDAGQLEADVFLLGESGDVFVELRGVCLQRIGPAGTGNAAAKRHWLYSVAWETLEPAPRFENGNGLAKLANSHWLVFEADRGVGSCLARQLSLQGAACTLVRPGNSFRRVHTNDPTDAAVYEIDPLSKSDYARLLELWRPPDGARRGIVHLWGLDARSAEAPGADLPLAVRRAGCGSLLLLVKSVLEANLAGSPSLCLVTEGAQAVEGHEVVSAAQAASWGMGRVAANEHPELAWRMIDLDPRQEPGPCAERLVWELARETGEGQIAFRGGKRFAARLQQDPEALDFAGPAVRSVADTGPRRLELDHAGTFDSLYYTRLKRSQPARGQVEIEVHSAGLNFSDVLKAVGLYPGITDRVVPLGIECSGVVTAVGEGVERFEVGTPVMGVAPYSFASHAITGEYALVERPAWLSHEEAATIPITFLTAHYALRRLGDLHGGQRVLVHAGAGGVGLAAIQIAQHVGAEIFATAGSDAKREFLRSLGVQHVLNSRTLEFADEILELTAGAGVDVVLNSLPGAAIDKSLSVLGAYGRFLEIGKVDIYQDRKIGLRPFQDNLSYFAIDLDRMLRQRPEYIRGLFEEVIGQFHKRNYQPLSMTCFRDDEIQDAFRYMAQRKNIGKVVISFEKRDAAKKPEAAEAEPVPPIRDDATYLVTGGLGNLGLRVARALAETGARYIALMGRSNPSESAVNVIESLKAKGGQVAVLRSDVSDLRAVRDALAQIPRDFPSLRGVFHAAGVLEDALLHEMGLVSLDKVLAPKVAGAWNLHLATAESPLDHFVLFSSVAGVLGSPGQANYAAGNAFLDGLAQHRRAQGQPGVSLSWGPWAGDGMAANVQQQLEARGMGPLPIDQAVEVFEASLKNAPPHLVIAKVDWDRLLGSESTWLTSFAAHLREEQPTASDRSDQVDEALRRHLSDADPETRTVLLRDYIAGEVAAVMETEPQHLELEQPLGSLGLDSLMAMELKAKLETRLGQSLPMGALLENPSVARLAEAFAPSLAWSSAEDASRDARSMTTSCPSAARRATSTGSTLRKLADSPAASPLIFVHPVGGDVACYYRLAKHLGSQQTVWALRARGLEEGTEPYDSVEELASDHLRVLRAELPRGPCYLSGWSTGGVFAYEMARQLLSDGEEVGGLFLLDTPSPIIFEGVDLDDHARFLVDLIQFSNWIAGTRMELDYRELKEQAFETALRTAFREVKRHGVLPSGASIDYLRRRVAVCREHSRAIMRYSLRPINVPVSLFRPANTEVLAAASGKTLSEDLDWGTVVGHQLSVTKVPGDHFSMMKGEHAMVLGDRLFAHLASAAGSAARINSAHGSGR